MLLGAIFAQGSNGIALNGRNVEVMDGWITNFHLTCIVSSVWFSCRVSFLKVRGRQMSTDPFEQFERSRGGLVIPLALFVMGGCLTYAAVSSLHGVVLREAEVARMIEAVPASDANPNEGSVVAPDVTADK